MVCVSGINWYLNCFKFKGEEIFEGDIVYSSFYCSLSILIGKCVFVVGVGNLGVDIVCDVVFVVDKVYIFL